MNSPHFVSCANLAPELIDRCASLIGGIAMSQDIDFHGLLWHPKTMTQIVQINEARELLGVLDKAWRKKTKTQAGVRICAILAAVEILNADLFGWGDKHPDARAQAKKLLDNADPQIQKKLLTIFRIVDNEDMGQEWNQIVAETLTAAA